MRQQESRGRRNWMKLKNIIHSGTLASKQKERKFQLFHRHIQHHPAHVLTTLSYANYTLFQKSPLPIYKEQLHFQGDVDATGRWVWEAEEVAAYYFLQSGEAIIGDVLMESGGKEGKVRILELGAGSSGLAGLALWQVAANLKGVKASIELTDGEVDNIRFLQDNIGLNIGTTESSSARKLLWGDASIINNFTMPPEQRRTYEIIVICDCLYFMAFHKQLLQTIDSLLSEKGNVFLVNPSRGDSMKVFLELAEQGGFESKILTFEDQKYQMQCERLRKDSSFDEDKHLLFFTKLSRKSH